MASYKGHAETVRYLLKLDVENVIPGFDEELHTALMEACIDGHVDVAKLLFEAGAQKTDTLPISALVGHLSNLHMAMATHPDLPCKILAAAYGDSFGAPPMGPMDGLPPQADGMGFGVENSVICLYGLEQEKVNCNKLFNLLCQYGNVVRIKFLKTKTDTIMVQMGDPVAAQRVIENLNRTIVLGKKLSVSMSHQPFINEVFNQIDLPDGSPSYQDFSDSRLNRFLTLEIASKNRLSSPQKYVYFFHASPRMTSEDVIELMSSNGPKPKSVKVFDQKDGAKTSAGIIEYEDEEEATEAVMLCNHVKVEDESSKYPYVVKLCYAGPQSGAQKPSGVPPYNSMPMRGRGRGGPLSASPFRGRGGRGGHPEERNGDGGAFERNGVEAGVEVAISAVVVAVETSVVVVVLLVVVAVVRAEVVEDECTNMTTIPIWEHYAEMVVRDLKYCYKNPTVNANRVRLKNSNFLALRPGPYLYGLCPNIATI
uniref:RRM domain-containing protein n=1 Tax=Romanomermis culicivorax TaxID=13658 RepID=A0A915IQX1_ROMCU